MLARRDVRMAATESPQANRQRLAMERLGLLVLGLLVERLREHRQTCGRLLVLLAVQLPPQLHRASGDSLALLVECEPQIHVTREGQDARLHFRLVHEPRLDPLEAAVQHLLRRDGRVLEPAGLELPEELRQDLRDLLGPPALRLRDLRLPARADPRARQRQENEQSRSHREAIAPHELSRAIPHAVLPRADGQPREVPLDVLCEGLGGHVAPLRGLAQRVQHDVVEIAAQRTSQTRRARRAVGRDLRAIARRIVGGRPFVVRARDSRAGPIGLRVEDGLLDLRHRARRNPVRPTAGQQFVGDDAERVHVRRGRHGRAADLLRRRVSRSHHPHARPRQRLCIRRLVLEQDLGDTEIEQLHRPLAGDEDVRRLEVAVHDEVAMRVANRVTHVEEQSQALANRKLAVVAIAIDRLALDVLHHEVRPAVLRHAAVDEPRDAGMLEACKDLTLGDESVEHVLGIETAADELDRHVLAVLIVVARREIDRAHAAASDRSIEAIGTDSFPRVGVGLRRGLPTRRPGGDRCH